MHRLVAELEWQKRGLVILLILFSIVIVCLTGVIIQKDKQRPPVIILNDKGNAEYMSHKDYEPKERQVKAVINIINHGFLSFSYANWKDGLNSIKPFIEKTLWQERYKYLEEHSSKLTKDKMNQVFHILGSSIQSEEPRFVVDIAGEVSVYGEFKPKKIKVVNRLIFDRIYPSPENPYGLFLVERFIVKEKETDEL